MSEAAIQELKKSGWTSVLCHDSRGRQYVHLKHRKTGAWLDVYRVGQALSDAEWGQKYGEQRLRAYDEADTIPVLRSSDCLHCYREHETCPYHSKYADRITPRTDTKPQPKVEPELLGASESLPEAPTEEAYRPGLPAWRRELAQLKDRWERRELGPNTVGKQDLDKLAILDNLRSFIQDQRAGYATVPSSVQAIAWPEVDPRANARARWGSGPALFVCGDPVTEDEVLAAIERAGEMILELQAARVGG